jgi:hypothetical protein
MSDHPSPRHPSNLATPFYSIRDGGRRNNSAAGSLSPNSYRSGRVAVTAALGHKSRHMMGVAGAK